VSTPPPQSERPPDRAATHAPQPQPLTDHRPSRDFEDRLVLAFQQEVKKERRQEHLRRTRPRRRAMRTLAAVFILGLLGLRAVGVNPLVSAFEALPDTATYAVVETVTDLIEPTPDYAVGELAAPDAPGYAMNLAAFHAGVTVMAEFLLWSTLAIVTLLLVRDLLRRRPEPSPDSSLELRL